MKNTSTFEYLFNEIAIADNTIKDTASVNPWTTASSQKTPITKKADKQATTKTPAISAETNKPTLDLNKLISLDEIEKFKKISNSSTKEYNKKMFAYKRDYDYWKKNGGTPGAPDEPKIPEDSRSSEDVIFGTIKELLELHNGKSSYIEAIDHMLKFTDDNYKSWFQRLKSKL
jgi:hypothetical protein